MDKPHILDAPGLAWRPRKNGWAAVWLARQDIASDGFKPSTRQIAVFERPPTEAEEIEVCAACVKFQEEMREFGHAKPKMFAGTLRALFAAYQTDPDSPYQTMRYKTRKHTDSLLRRIDAKHGTMRLVDIGVREIKHIYNGFRWPDGKEGRELVSTGHAVMTALRMAVSFGMTFEVEKAPRDRISECARIRAVLSELKFENAAPRTEAMTLRQCEDIIEAAHRLGFPSMALAQALQFDLRTRQGDIIGQWVPVTEPGISVIPPSAGRKWLRGLRHEEISSTWELDHPIAKSRTGKRLQRDLRMYPMALAELEHIPADKRTGPVVICEITGRPWKQNNFRIRWREIATAAGVPNSVFNMDSRAGGITETIEATGGNLEAARKEAEHSDQKMTARYSRRKKQANNETAVIVADFRAKNKA